MNSSWLESDIVHVPVYQTVLASTWLKQLQEWKSRVGVVFGCADEGSKSTLHPIRPTHENTPDPPQKEKQETAPPPYKRCFIIIISFQQGLDLHWEIYLLTQVSNQ